MKKLIFGMLLALTACVFTSCQKGEKFFDGTWQAVGTYSYEDKYGEEVHDVYTVDLTLNKKDGAVTWTENFPKDKTRYIDRKGTYTYYNEHTISVTLDETKEDYERVFLMHCDKEYDDNNTIYGGYYDENDNANRNHYFTFTRVKGNKNK